MKTTLTAQQTAFFTKNGFIELEIAHEFPSNRAGWRDSPELQDFLMRKLGPLALALTGKKQLRLASDQWILRENRPTKPSPLKGILSIQGVAIAVAFAENPTFPSRRSPLGLLPLAAPGHLLFFRPEIILDWPFSDIYLATYAFPTAVYVYNPKDPLTHSLKQLGYQFGDLLKNETHPLIWATTQGS